MAGALVLIHEATTRTGEDGAFEQSDLPVGKTMLRVYKEDGTSARQEIEARKRAHEKEPA